MALAEQSRGGIGRFFRRPSPQFETPATNIVGADFPACPDSEGDVLTGADASTEPFLSEPLMVRIIGSRNPFTGEIAEYDKEAHGRTYPVQPLAINQEFVIPQ